MHDPDSSATRPAGGNSDLAETLEGARLLLVEDNEISQEIAAELLAGAGATVDIANQGQEAIDMLELQAYDAVLMDCQMPVLDGYEATRRLRRDRRHMHLPIIAMTASNSGADLHKAAEAGMDDIIAKPLDVREMVATIAKALRRRDAALARGSQSASGGAAALTPEIPRVVPPAPKLHSLPDLPGIDVYAGLRVMAGDEEFYRQMLQTFARTQGNFGEVFKAALASADRNSVARTPHTLKGVAASIGAPELQKLASRLESACRAEPLDLPSILALQAELEAELLRVIDGINRLIPAA